MATTDFQREDAEVYSEAFTDARNHQDFIDREGRYTALDAGEAVSHLLKADYGIEEAAYVVDENESFNLPDAEKVAETLKWEYGEEVSELFIAESDYTFYQELEEEEVKDMLARD